MSFEQLQEPTPHNMMFSDINFDADLWYIPCENKPLNYLHRDGTIQEGTADTENTETFFREMNESTTENDMLEVFTGYFGSVEEAIQARIDYYTTHDEKI